MKMKEIRPKGTQTLAPSLDPLMLSSFLEYTSTFFSRLLKYSKSSQVVVVAITSVMSERGPFCVTNFVCPRFRMRSNLIFEERTLLGRIITHKVTVKSVKNYNTIDLNFC